MIPFRFGIGYWPTFEITSQKTTYSGTSVEVETYEDGDGVASPADYVQTTTVNAAGHTETSTKFLFKNYISTGAQFYLVPKRLRVNLGAYVYGGEIFDKETTEVTTAGMITREEQISYNEADPVVTDYQVSDDVRAAIDHERQITDLGASMSVNYQAGFTWFFSDSMYLDFIFTGGASPTFSIWEPVNWSFIMTILFP
ncbi:unnamed protein product [marine sediment metagenome]|uniref:Outer membrane protein beta-barrel domain-containing protein n=1 Tax=marine sediment metagenome TaxID=412755 RepID=X1C225_9ZZZZ